MGLIHSLAVRVSNHLGTRYLISPMQNYWTLIAGSQGSSFIWPPRGTSDQSSPIISFSILMILQYSSLWLRWDFREGMQLVFKVHQIQNLTCAPDLQARPVLHGHLWHATKGHVSSFISSSLLDFEKDFPKLHFVNNFLNFGF